jgi:predicted TIM-barrel fold metal-dependent hydrolase
MTDNAAHPARPATIRGPAKPTHTPTVKFPVGSCDCHSHVFGTQERYPYRHDAAYIAEFLPPEEYARMLTAIGCTRAVLVQPSVYGTDNRCMVDAMKSGVFDFRGVAVTEPDISDKELRELHDAGVRGLRINAASKTPGLRMEHAPELAKRIAPLGWHLQFFVNVDKTPGFIDEVAHLPVPCVIDHFGHVHAEDGVDSPGFQIMLKLARMEHLWFKLSGGYRVSKLLPPYEDVAPLAQALLSRAEDRCVFGTDWPHPNIQRMDNDGDLADALALWVPDEKVRKKVLVDNPARLYDFS